jgi:hypothetical protein
VGDDGGGDGDDAAAMRDAAAAFSSSTFGTVVGRVSTTTEATIVPTVNTTNATYPTALPRPSSLLPDFTGPASMTGGVLSVILPGAS